MSVFIPRQICRKEFGQNEVPSLHKEVILRAHRKGVAGLAARLKGQSLPKHSRLIKVYATTTGGPRRLVFLVDTRSDRAYLLFYRDKNDEVGANISIKNPAFSGQLQRYLQLLLEDIDNGNIEIVE